VEEKGFWDKENKRQTAVKIAHWIILFNILTSGFAESYISIVDFIFIVLAVVCL